MNTSTLAIAVPVFLPSATSPRVEYFKRHLANLALASRHWPVYFYIDGGGDTPLALQLIDEAGIHVHDIDVTSIHLGLGLNIHRARRETFAQGHDAVFLCEDDTLITYDLVTLLGHVLDWATRQGWSPAIVNSSIYKHSASESALTSDLLNLTHYLLPRAAYDTMRPGLDEYAALLAGHDYAARPDAAIKAWMRDRYATPAIASTYQDHIFRTIARKLGIYTFSLARNRAIHLGETGTNSNLAWHASAGLSSQHLNPHPDDTTQRHFFLIPTPTVAPGSGGSISG